MKKQKSHGGNSPGQKQWFIGILLVAAIAVLSLLFLFPKEESSVLKELQEKNGYIRTVEKEEYDFFQKLVERDLTEKLSPEELEAKTKAKINRVNAEFLLANQMGLCGPYSFESFQLDMENENTRRELKKERNEVFYGPEQFDLITYYNYISGNLKLDMVTYIIENADSEVMAGAKKYFKENKENYRTIEKIVYLLTENGSTEEKNLLYEDMSTLEKTDSKLFEFLYNGKEGDELEYVYQENSREVEIKSVEYQKLNLKNNIERVMRDYVTNIYLENWLQKIEEKCSVEFQLL